MVRGGIRFQLKQPIDEELVENIERLPGLRVWGHEIAVPHNAVAVVRNYLDGLGVQYTAPSLKELQCVPHEALRNVAELQPWVYDFTKPFQRDGVCFSLSRPNESAYLWHPTGAGKSLECLIWGLYRPGLFCIVTKAGARRTLQLEVQKYTTVRPVVLKPKSERKKSEPEPEIRDDTRIVIVGWESLPDFLPMLLAQPITSLALDELHKGKSHRRWAVVPGVGENGEDKKTFRKLDNTASAIHRLRKNVKRALGMSATPIADRRRDLWAQLDLIQPGQWGKYWTWAARYCGLTTNTFGARDDKGRSNTEEFQARLKQMMHYVGFATTHAELPPLRRLPSYIPRSEQDKPAAFAKELERAQRSGSKSLLEVRLAEACSRKRTAILDRVDGSVRNGGKVVVFTARHADCERLTAAFAKRFPSVTQWSAHGGHGTSYRDEIREAYMAHPGPCVLIGTGEAWGESYNLQDTDHALFAMLPITPKQLFQWEGRFARHGMKRPCMVEYLIAENTADDHIANILLSKLPAVAELGDDHMGDAYQELLGNAKDIESKLFDAVMQQQDPLADDFLEGEDGPELETKVQEEVVEDDL